MKKKMMMIIFSCIVLAIAAISRTHASNMVLIPGMKDVTEVRVTAKIKDINLATCDGTFFHEQQMVIPGMGPVWVHTDQEFMPGPYEAIPLESCQSEDGFYELQDLR